MSFWSARIAPRARRLGASALLLLAAAALRAQPATEAPDLATLRKQQQAMWEQVIGHADETDPMFRAQGIGVLITSELMIERAELVARGAAEVDMRELGQRARDRVLARWHELRPRDGGPELFRTFEVQDPAARLPLVLPLLERYPDDPLVLWNASSLLQQTGQMPRAGELLRGYVARHPDVPWGYRMLAGHYSALQDATRQTEVMATWAARLPADPAMMSMWASSDLPRQEPEATARVIDAFLAAPPSARGLDAYRQIGRIGSPAQREAARTAIGRLAAKADAATPEGAQAISALLDLSAAGGDWSAVLAALAALPPRERRHALVNAAYQVNAPERCAGRIDLIENAVNGAGAGDAEVMVSAASALAACGSDARASRLLLDLLRRLPASELRAAIGGWSYKRDDEWRSENLPLAATTALLEQRLAAEPRARGVYAALDLVDRIAGDEPKLLALLERWDRDLPGELPAEQAIDLARARAERDPAAAAALLDRVLQRGFDSRVVEAQWQLAAVREPARAATLAAELAASDDPARSSLGHLLAARSAALVGDAAAAREQYWAQLRGAQPREDAALELLELVATPSSPAAESPQATLARQICATTKVPRADGDDERCASGLLARLGDRVGATAVLARRADELPDDLPTLRSLATQAQQSGHLELAERALARVVELDPRSEPAWEQLALVYEKQVAVDKAEALVKRAREQLSQPPVNVLRAAGRTCVAGGRPRRGIELLLEARAAMPPGWDAAYVNDELRQAYAALGKQP